MASTQGRDPSSSSSLPLRHGADRAADRGAARDMLKVQMRGQAFAEQEAMLTPRPAAKPEGPSSAGPAPGATADATTTANTTGAATSGPPPGATPRGAGRALGPREVGGELSAADVATLRSESRAIDERSMAAFEAAPSNRVAAAHAMQAGTIHTAGDYHTYLEYWRDAGGKGEVPTHGFIGRDGQPIVWGPSIPPVEHRALHGEPETVPIGSAPASPHGNDETLRPTEPSPPPAHGEPGRTTQPGLGHPEAPAHLEPGRTTEPGLGHPDAPAHLEPGRTTQLGLGHPDAPAHLEPGRTTQLGLGHPDAPAHLEPGRTTQLGLGHPGAPAHLEHHPDAEPHRNAIVPPPPSAAGDEPVVPMEAGSPLDEVTETISGAQSVVEGIAQAQQGTGELMTGTDALMNGDALDGSENLGRGLLDTAAGGGGIVDGMVTAAGVPGVGEAIAPVALAATAVEMDRAGSNYAREHGLYGQRNGVAGTRSARGPQTQVNNSADDVADEAGREIEELTGSPVLGALGASANRLAMMPQDIVLGARSQAHDIAVEADEQQLADTGQTLTQEVAEDRQMIADATGSEAAANVISTGEHVVLAGARAAESRVRGVAASGHSDNSDIEAADQEGNDAPEAPANPRETTAQREHRASVSGHRQRIRHRNQTDHAAASTELAARGATDLQNYDPRVAEAERANRAARGDNVPVVQAPTFTSITENNDAEVESRRTAWARLGDQCTEMKHEERRSLGLINSCIDGGDEEHITQAVHCLNNVKTRFGRWAQLLKTGQQLAKDSGNDWWHLERPHLPAWQEIIGKLQAGAHEIDIQFPGSAYMGGLRATMSGLPV